MRDQRRFGDELNLLGLDLVNGWASSWVSSGQCDLCLSTHTGAAKISHATQRFDRYQTARRETVKLASRRIDVIICYNSANRCMDTASAPDILACWRNAVKAKMIELGCSDFSKPADYDLCRAIANSLGCKLAWQRPRKNPTKQQLQDQRLLEYLWDRAQNLP